MATVYQPSLFSWKDADELGDLERLQLVIEHMPDQPLLVALKSLRGRGRNAYELGAMWNLGLDSNSTWWLTPTTNFPVAKRVTKASLHDAPVIKEMSDQLAKDHPGLLEDCEHGIGDKGYDDTALIIDLMAKYNIKAIIDIRNMWKDKR